MSNEISFQCYVAYIKGGEQERFNPLTGRRYEKSQSHDVIESEDTPVASTSTGTTNKESYASRRGRPEFIREEEVALLGEVLVDLTHRTNNCRKMRVTNRQLVLTSRKTSSSKPDLPIDYHRCKWIESY